MDTVARPELEGSGTTWDVQQVGDDDEADPPNPATACSAQYSTVSVIRPLFMITVMPRATPMISATPSMSRAPSTKVSTRFFPTTADDADQDAEEQEISRHLREPPPPGGDGDAQVLPGDHAVDHDDESQEEEQQDHLMRPVNSRNLCLPRCQTRTASRFRLLRRR